jgi:plastocyanin
MELTRGLLTLVPLVVADTSLDPANLLIGLLTLGVGLLGLAYLVMALVTTPQPRTEPVEQSAYPDVDRFLVPLALPVGVALTIAIIILLTSQILLVVPEAAATPIALGIALFVLVACSIVATAPKISKGAIYTLVGVPLLVLIIAGSISGMVRMSQAKEEAAAAAAQQANTPLTALNETTTDDKFSKTAFISPAGQAVTLTQTNKGAAIHNWHILDTKDASGQDIATALTNPGSTSTVTFTIASAGTYKFQCDVHPTEMFGTIKIQ